MNLPRHIVLIPDGNRRWAKKKGLPSFLGHREGAKNTEKILKAALDLGIENFTFWGSSVDNIAKRSPQEVKFLLKVFEIYFKKLAKSKYVHENGVRINVFGRWKEMFSPSAKKAIQSAIDKTRKYNKCELTVLLAYSGMDEMTSAIRNIVKLSAKGGSLPDGGRGASGGKSRNSKLEIDGDLIKQNLWTKNLPPVDLVIRTGGEPHLSSGMMMWDVADSQLYFTDTLYPDFSVAEFQKAIQNYARTERRMGK